MFAASGSMPRSNSTHDIGSPRLTPLVTRKGLLTIPFIITDVGASLYRAFTVFIISTGKAKFPRTSHRYGCVTFSYAFSWSSATIAPFGLFSHRAKTGRLSSVSDPRSPSTFRFSFWVGALRLICWPFDVGAPAACLAACLLKENLLPPSWWVPAGPLLPQTLPFAVQREI